MKLKLPLTLLLAAGAACQATHAADWFLKANQGSTDNWNTLTSWSSSPVSGAGTSPTAINAADTFYLNGKSLRTPYTSVNETFPATLVLDGGYVTVKSKSQTAITAIPKLVSQYGITRTLAHANTGTQKLSVGLNVPDGDPITFDTGATATRILDLTLTSVAGAGAVEFTGVGTTRVTMPAASTNFYGSLLVQETGNRVSFQNDFVSNGGLVIDDGAQILLSHNITVSSLIVGGTVPGSDGVRVGATTYAPNATYTWATLNAANPAIFPAGGSGSITVTQPQLAADAGTVIDIEGAGQLGTCVGTPFWRETRVDYGAALKTLRMGIGRMVVAPYSNTTPVDFTLKDTDTKVLQLLNRGVQPLFVQLCGQSTHAAYFADNLRNLDGTVGGGTPASNMTFLVQRYMAPPFNLTHQVWEVHNEPDLATNLQLTPAQYVTYFQSIHNQLIASGVRGNVTLCGPVASGDLYTGSSSPGSDSIMLALMNATQTPLNGFQQLDVLTRHLYASITTNETKFGDPTPNNAYNFLNAPCEQVTFTRACVQNPNGQNAFGTRGEGGIIGQLRSRGMFGTGTGLTEFNVGPNYLKTITQGLWFLTLDHFEHYNPANIVSTGFQFDYSGTDNLSYFDSFAPSFGYWANYVHGNLSGDQILPQYSSDSRLLVTATKDPTYVYLQVLNRNVDDMTASVALSNAPVTGTPTRFELSATTTPNVGTATALGTTFTETFPAMTARVYRYLRSDAPTPPTTPPTPAITHLSTDFTSAPTGMLIYYQNFSPFLTAGDLQMTRNANPNDQAGAVIFNGQPLPTAQARVQVRFGFRMDAGHADGLTFNAYTINPGVVGGSGDSLGFYGQPNQIWGVKLDTHPILIGGNSTAELGVSANVAPIVNDMVNGGYVTAPLDDTYRNQELYMVIDYDGPAGSVRARMFAGTSDTAPVLADVTNSLGNVSSLPAGTVFGFTASTNTVKETVSIHDLLIKREN